MGVQTLKPELLSVLGRTHNTEDIYTSVLNAKLRYQINQFRFNVSLTETDD